MICTNNCQFEDYTSKDLGDVIGIVLCQRRFKGSECNGDLNFLFSPARAYLEAIYPKVLTSFLSRPMVSAILLRMSMLASFACAHLVMFAPPWLYLKRRLVSYQISDVLEIASHHQDLICSEHYASNACGSHTSH